VVDVVPTVASTSSGRTPAATSASTARRSESAVTDNEDGSTSRTRIAASPSPAIRTAFSPAEWVSGDR
jgi:hypothetical protein